MWWRKTATARPAELPARSALAMALEPRMLFDGAVAATVSLEGDPSGPVLAPDGQFVYLLDRGKPSDNPDKNVNGKLHAVSMSTRAVAAVTDVGSKPRGLVLDEQRKRLLLLSDGQPVKGPGNNERPGELRVIAGAAPAAPLSVVNMPERVEQSAGRVKRHVEALLRAIGRGPFLLATGVLLGVDRGEQVTLVFVLDPGMRGNVE